MVSGRILLVTINRGVVLIVRTKRHQASTLLFENYVRNCIFAVSRSKNNTEKTFILHSF